MRQAAVAMVLPSTMKKSSSAGQVDLLLTSGGSNQSCLKARCQRLVVWRMIIWKRNKWSTGEKCRRQPIMLSANGGGGGGSRSVGSVNTIAEEELSRECNPLISWESEVICEAWWHVSQCCVATLPAAEEKEEIIQTWLDKKRLESLFHRKRKKLI